VVVVEVTVTGVFNWSKCSVVHVSSVLSRVLYGRDRVGRIYCFMAERGFKIASKSLLGEIVCSSFMWLSFKYSE
jgi:hypothetical protein